MKLVFTAVLAVALAACSKSKCEKYADMEVKCGKEKGDMVHKLAEGFCDKAQKEKDPFSQMLNAEAACATKHADDCAAYEACKEAFKFDDKQP